MVWTCFISHATGALHIIDGKMDGATYRQILEKSLISSAKRLFKNRKLTFQQDNDSKHKFAYSSLYQMKTVSEQ